MPIRFENNIGMSVRSGARLGPGAAELDQLDSPYLSRERVYANDPHKKRHRLTIARMFLRTLSKRARVHCLSLPSYHWTFERELLALRQDATFVGIERNRSVLDESFAYIPGAEKRRYTRHLSIGVMDGWASTATKHLWMSMGDLVSLTPRDVAPDGATGRKRSDFNHKFRRFSCAWLDFQSPICGEVELALRALPCVLDAEIPTAPVAVTVMRAREVPQVTERIEVFGSRSSYLRVLLGMSGAREVLPVRDIEYISPGGTAMLLMLVKLRMKRSTTNASCSSKRRESETP